MGLAEGCFIVYAFLLFCGGILPLVTPDDVNLDSPANNRAALFCGMVLLLMAAAFILPNLARTTRRLLAVTPIALLLAFTAASMFWSTERMATIHTLFYLFITVVIAAYFGSRLTTEQQLRLFCIAVGIAVVLTLLLWLVAPWRAFDPAAGGLRGNFAGKNGLGKTMGLGAVSFYLLPTKRRWLRLGMTAGCLALIFVADSLTPLLAIIILAILSRPLAGLSSKRGFRRKVIAAICLLLVLGSLIVAHLGTFLQVAHRSQLLTGRIPLWLLVAGDIRQKPLLGYGYAAYWNDLANRQYAKRMLHWDPGQCHNGYLQLSVNLGLAGLMLFLGAYVDVLRKAAERLRTRAGRGAMWPIALLLYVLIYNWAEVAFWEPYNIGTVLFVMVATSLAGPPRYSRSPVVAPLAVQRPQEAH